MLVESFVNLFFLLSTLYYRVYVVVSPIITSDALDTVVNYSYCSDVRFKSKSIYLFYACFFFSKSKFDAIDFSLNTNKNKF